MSLRKDNFTPGNCKVIVETKGLVFPNTVSGTPETNAHYKSSQLTGYAVTTGHLSRHSIFMEDSLSLSNLTTCLFVVG